MSNLQGTPVVLSKTPVDWKSILNRTCAVVIARQLNWLQVQHVQSATILRPEFDTIKIMNSVNTQLTIHDVQKMGTLGTLDAGWLGRRHVADNQTAHFGVGAQSLIFQNKQTFRIFHPPHWTSATVQTPRIKAEKQDPREVKVFRMGKIACESSLPGKTSWQE